MWTRKKKTFYSRNLIEMVDNDREKNKEASFPKHVPLDEKLQKLSEFQVTFFW